jgi:hypothetical protein
VVVSLDELATRVRPVALAGEARLPVAAPLEPLLAGGLRRGSTVTVHGSTSLALGLLARATVEGSWAAIVGVPSLGLAAAEELGVDLARLALVPNPGGQWAIVAAALVDAFDLVVVAPPGRAKPADARRLTAKTRERGAVLVPVGAWPEPADVRLGIASAEWQGLGDGHGRLRARRVEVVAQGRGAAARERRVQLWLPGPDGPMSTADDATAADVQDPTARRGAVTKSSPTSIAVAG